MAAGGARQTPEAIADQLLAKCGERADILIDCVLSKAHHFHPAVKWTRQVTVEQVQLGRRLWDRPLLQLLQLRAASCSCSPLGRLRVLSAVLSGSQMEGFGDVEATLRLDSDFDTMFELGPVQWAADGAEQTGPRLRAVPTANAGFVRLLQEPLEECRHTEPLPLSAADIRRLLQLSAEVRRRPGDTLGASGPATALTSNSRPRLAGSNDDDLVPCLRAPWWPAAEFVTRRRTRDWPPAAVRREIQQFGVHLVPTGCAGSSTELSEWRLSFSRAEVVAAWHLTEQQRCSLIALKACKARLGPHGKGVKSYYMKTALYWLCQERPASGWASPTQGARDILDFLEEAVTAGRLPSFFWAEINLLGRTTAEEREGMLGTLSLLRRELPRLLLAACAQLHMRTLGPVLVAAGQPLSEHQLRTCLARALVLEAVILMASFGTGLIQNQDSIQVTVPVLVRAAAAPELRRMCWLAAALVGPQLLLLRALLVAPPEVAGRARLSADGAGGLRWDAAPLVALLTDDQWAMLVRRPAAVAAWCRHHGTLTAELNTPRGRADLLLNGPLMERALRACAPEFVAVLLRSSEQQRLSQRSVVPKPLISLAEARQEATADYHSDLAGRLRRALDLTEAAAERLARDWRHDHRRFWSDPATGAEYERIRRSVPNAWQLRQYVTGGPVAASATT
ncbi:Protein MB21D2 [Amphibalanus amphitrite]|uniref:Protein MB21D2 n=1 Tax=Amphibalanus amphitrite TaxID=1232801 RepID=A0A6A4VUB9_AMPAM|nr:Protein MB21D2 [Amphibalanus amphitrite]